jgi:hypothetical protein
MVKGRRIDGLLQSLKLKSIVTCHLDVQLWTPGAMPVDAKIQLRMATILR